MRERISRLIPVLIWCATLAPAVGSTSAWGRGDEGVGSGPDATARPGANHPLILNETSRATEAGPAGESASPPSTDGAAAASTSASAAVPAHEQAPLGRDAGLLRLGSATAEPQNADSSAGEGAGERAWGELTRTGGALAAVIGLMLLLAVAVRSTRSILGRGRSPAGVLEVLARYPLRRRHELMLLKLDRRLILVHQCPTAMSALCEVSQPDEVASVLARVEAGSRKSGAKRFNDLLRGESDAYERPGRRAGRAGAARRGVTGTVEMVDLTRTQGHGLRRSVGPRSVTA